MLRFLAAVSLLLSLIPSATAQFGGENAGCTLIVRVRSADNRSVSNLISLQLLSSQGVPLARRNIVEGEEAHFQIANGKSYGLVVTGSGIETVRTNFFLVSALELSHTEIIEVKPDPKTQPGETVPDTPSVSVNELMIPDKPAAELQKGLDDYAKGSLDKAATHFQKAIHAYPNFARAYDLLGVIAIKQSNRAKARELFSKAINVDGTYFPTYLDMGRMDIQDQNYADAERVLTRAATMNPSSPDAIGLLATAEFASKHYDKALADVQRTHALPNHAEFADLHLMAAQVLRKQNHREQAIAQYRLFLQENPDSPEIATARKALAALEDESQP